MFSHPHPKTGEPLYLHKQLAKNQKAFIYFFSREAKDAIDLPPFLEVKPNPNSGLPFVKRKKEYR